METEQRAKEIVKEFKERAELDPVSASQWLDAQFENLFQKALNKSDPSQAVESFMSIIEIAYPLEETNGR